MEPTVISVNVSQVKEIEWKGKLVRTGIFKDPVEEKVVVKGVNIVGDNQADRVAHGGVNKAIYGYPIEHYSLWKQLHPDLQWQYGMFGENLTTQGLLEHEVYVGDTFKIGSVELIAVQPRVPCYKLGVRFGTQKIVKQFYEADFSGIYFKILKKGEFQAGDTIEKIQEDPGKVSIKELYDLFRQNGTLELLERVTNLKHVPDRLRSTAREILNGTRN